MLSPPPPLFRDPSQPRASRVADLLERLTVEEKISQLLHGAPAVQRLDVPAYNWWNEACHGVARNGRATVFPQVIGLAATWDRDLVCEVAATIAREARAKHHAAVARGERGQYQGLTFWTPNVNLFRDPRWGRGQETFGEDPHLTGELGLAMVRGLQGDDPERLVTAACAKHFAVHSGPEQDRHHFDARPSPRDLAESYLPAFEKLVRGGVEAVMGAYNRVLGEPACASRLLLVDILRDRWGFSGHVVSDCGAIADFHLHHRVTPDAAHSAALAVRMGCDLECGCTYRHLVEAARDGLVTEAEIDASVERLLHTRFKLGLLDPEPPRERWSGVEVDGPRHRALAREAAARSMVLLKNDGVLPLTPGADRLLVCGPTAANIGALIGNYHGFSPRLVTFAEGIAARCAEGTLFDYRMGCPLQGAMAPGVNYTYDTAADCGVTIACLGLDHSLEGEEGDAVASPGGGDRRNVELPQVQVDFLRELRRRAKRLVVVLTGGGAIAAPEVHGLADAVLLAWYPGAEGGHALGDVLFGDVAPGGRLPVSVPMRTADLPAFDDYAMAGRTYRYAAIEPLYPFGFGLGYSEIGYEAGRDPGGGRVAVTVVNRGARAARETVQCYVVPPPGDPGAPRARLVDFQVVELEPGARSEVVFTLGAEAFRRCDDDGVWHRGEGVYTVVIGPAAPGGRARALGAPEAVELMVDASGVGA